MFAFTGSYTCNINALSKLPPERSKPNAFQLYDRLEERIAYIEKKLNIEG
jgi:hypothetical protein